MEAAKADVRFLAAERFCLRSLLEMLRFYAVPFAQTISQLTFSAQQIDYMDSHLGPAVKNSQPVNDLIRESLADVLAGLSDTFSRLIWSPTLTGQYQRFLTRLGDPLLTRGELVTRLFDLRDGFFDELRGMLFYQIQPRFHDHYEQPSPPFGEDVADQFRDADYDVKAAARCLALEEWTAAVFHLMRVVEVGLHYFASDMGIEMKEGLDFAEWGAILNQIDAKLKAVEQQLPRGAEKSELQEFQSRVALNISHFNHAFRQHVSHVRGRYDDREAPEIYGYVRTFMQQLATHRRTNP